MADDKKPGGGKKKGGKMKLMMIMIIMGFAAPFLMPTLVIVILGMMPTFVALLTDNDREKSATASVGMMNIAGVVPFVIDLWMKGQTMENAFHILTDSSTWLVMLGAAGVGQLIVFAIPQAMASLTLARAEARLKTLKQNLDQLRVSWGPDVATMIPLDKIGRGE